MPVGLGAKACKLCKKMIFKFLKDFYADKKFKEWSVQRIQQYNTNIFVLTIIPSTHENRRFLIFRRMRADDVERRRFKIERGCNRLN